ncbi:MAG: DNA-binding protein [Candidatus Melainabacteria bacterium]|nr:MAG: DNA-binding protein [Candidatus Melainabacteria bacterium]
MKNNEHTPYGVGAANSILLTRREAAAYLGVAEQTLAVWKCTGRRSLPFVKIGRLVRYRKADLDAFILEHLQDFEHDSTPKAKKSEN